MSGFVVAPDRRKVKAAIARSVAMADAGPPPDEADLRIAAVEDFLGKVAHDRVVPAGTTDRSGPSFRATASARAGAGVAASVQAEIVTIRAEPDELAARRREARQAARDLPVIVEESRPRYPGTLGPAGFAAIRASAAFEDGGASDADGSHDLAIAVTGPAGPLAAARIRAFFSRPNGRITREEVFTGPDGRAEVAVLPGVPVTIQVEPAADHWPMTVTLAPDTPAVAVPCPPIAGSTGERWWREFAVAQAFGDASGAGIVVGVVDSGVGPHPWLDHVARTAVLGAGASPAFPAADDLVGHGSHVCGVIGARPPAGAGKPGLAPAADLRMIRVFGGSGVTDQGVTSAAIQRLSEDGAHLINLSLSAPLKSRIERQYVQEALERGTLCIAAAGNHAGGVEYPAAYPEVVAVAAIGSDGAWMAGSPSAGRLPATAADRGLGGLFGANFSNRGKQVNCHAPGVAIVSTVANAARGTAGEAVMDGTSMAAPFCTGLLAALLSADPAYRAMAADKARALAARAILKRAIAATGLPAESWGAGAVRG